MTITNNFDTYEIIKELTYFLRNQDVISTTNRGVTTAEQTGTMSGGDNVLIDKTNIKNIRSVTIGVSSLSYGTDYTINTNYSNSTIKCKVDFGEAKNGDYTISYDYGTDKIYPDYPRVTDLSFDSYPRIGVDIIAVNSRENSIYGDAIHKEALVEIVIADTKRSDLEDLVTSVEQKIKNNAKKFYYFNYIEPYDMSPLLIQDKSKTKVFQRNLTFKIPYHTELIS